MTISTAIIQTRVARGAIQPAPVSVSADWFTLLAAGAPNDADTAVITRPDSMDDADHYRVTVEGHGTYLFLRAGYTAADAPVTPLAVRAFGRDAGGKWQRLPLLDGTLICTFSYDATNDVSDGTLQYTSVDVEGGTNVFDLLGSKDILLLVSTACAGGSVRTADICQGLIL